MSRKGSRRPAGSSEF